MPAVLDRHQPEDWRGVRSVRQWQDGDQRQHRTIRGRAGSRHRVRASSGEQFRLSGHSELERRQRQLCAGLRPHQSTGEPRVRTDFGFELRQEQSARDPVLARRAHRVGPSWIQLAGQHQLSARVASWNRSQRRVLPYLVWQLHRDDQHGADAVGLLAVLRDGAPRSAPAWRGRLPGVRQLRREPREVRPGADRRAARLAVRRPERGLQRARCHGECAAESPLRDRRAQHGTHGNQQLRRRHQQSAGDGAAIGSDVQRAPERSVLR